MKLVLKIIPLCLLICFSAPVEQAEAQDAQQTVYRFLQLSSSPRAAALGGNHVAMNDADASLTFINPAYISERMDGNFAISYLNHISDVNMGFVSTAWDMPYVGMIAAGVRFIDYGEIRQSNAMGEDLGSMSARDLALSVGHARPVAENLTAGISTALIYSGYGPVSSGAFSVTGGLFYYLESAELNIGAVVSNVGTQIRTFSGRNEPLPIDIRLGVSRKLENLPLRLNLTAHSLQQWEIKTANDEEDPDFLKNLLRHFTLGGELMISSSVHIRVGYDHLTNSELKAGSRLDTAGFALGVGFRIKGIQFDLSQSSFSELGGVTRIGIHTYL